MYVTINLHMNYINNSLVSDIKNVIHIYTKISYNIKIIAKDIIKKTVLLFLIIKQDCLQSPRSIKLN